MARKGDPEGAKYRCHICGEHTFATGKKRGMNWDKKLYLVNHLRMKHNVESEVTAEANEYAELKAEKEAREQETAARRSRRAQREAEAAILTPLQQIPDLPGAGSGARYVGAGAYYLNPNGATITEALTWSPNGGVPQTDNPRLAARFGTNAEVYRAQMARKGFEYVGPSLTEGGIHRLVEILEENRPDAILYCEDEIERAERASDEEDRPEYRNQARRRVRQFRQRKAMLEQPLDADALEQELRDIANAQELANLDPAILRVMRRMIGDSQADMVAQLQRGSRQREGAPGRVLQGAGVGGEEGLEFDRD